MKRRILMVILAIIWSPAALAADGDPLAKVLEMMDDLTAKVQKAGEAESKAYGEFFEWCDDTAKNTQFEIKTAAGKKADLVAAIDKLSSDIEDCDVKIADLVAALAKDSKELKAATAVRDREHADFSAEESELMEGIDTLDRAIGIIEKAMSKAGGAAFAQVDSRDLKSLLQAIGAMMDAASVDALSKNKLLALVQQAREADSDNSEDTGAPAPSAYESKSGGIVDVLEEMKGKAEEELDSLRAQETASKNNFAMLKQSLEDSMAADNKDLDDEKAAKAAAEEDKATSSGDLEVTTKALAESEKELETMQNMCMQTATDHELSTKSRAEELKVIAEAKGIIEESTGAAAGADSLFQTNSLSRHRSRIRSHSRRKFGNSAANSQVITFVKQLAKQHHSPALAQLASRIAATMKFGRARGEDPFAKIKGLITDMIAKLEREAKEDAQEKAYCDEQLAKTEEKKSSLDSTIEKLSSKIDKASAKSTQLKDDVKVLQEELATLAKEQKEMDKIRSSQHAAYLEAKEDLEKGLAGIRKALEMLRKYYGGSAAASMLQSGFDAAMEQPKMPEFHSAEGGAGGGIISMLEVCESDFAKDLATTEKEEADSAEEYETETQENDVAKSQKTQDVKYKTQEFTSLDKSVADLSADRETAGEELAAVMKYYEKIKDRCIAKPISYEEIKKRREAEIKGLKEALSILEGSFLQSGRRHGHNQHFLSL